MEGREWGRVWVGQIITRRGGGEGVERECSREWVRVLVGKMSTREWVEYLGRADVYEEGW